MNIYTFGEGVFLSEIISSVINLMNAGPFGILVKITVLLGLFILLWQLVFSFNISNIGLGMLKHYFYIILIWYIMFLPKVPQVQIEDLVDSNNSRLLSNVPYGIAIFGHIFSTIEKNLAELFQDSFYTVIGDHTWDYTTSGYAFPLVSVDILRDASWGDPYIKRTMSSFMQNCFFLDVLMGSIDLNDIVNDTTNNLWAKMQPQMSGSHSMWTQIYNSANPMGLQDTCANAYTAVSNAMGNELTNGSATASAILGRDIQGSLYLYVNSLLGSSITDTNQVLSQALTANLMSDAMSAAAVQNGLSGDALAYATALAQQQQRTTWATGAELAKKYMPIIRQIMLSLLYGIFPILFILMFLPWGTTYLKLYATLFTWMAMWAPLYSIINFLIATRAKTVLGPAQGVFSIGRMPYIYQSTNDLVSMAGYLSFSVPMLAFAIAKGSEYALTSVIGGLTGGAQSTASSAGSQISGPDAGPKMASAAAHLSASQMHREQYSAAMAANAFNSIAGGMALSNIGQQGQMTLQNANTQFQYGGAKGLEKIANATDTTIQDLGENAKIGLVTPQVGRGMGIKNQGINQSQNMYQQKEERNIQDQKAYQEVAAGLGYSGPELQNLMSKIQHAQAAGNAFTIKDAKDDAVSKGYSEQQFFRALGQATQGNATATAQAGHFDPKEIANYQQTQQDMSYSQVQGMIAAAQASGHSLTDISFMKGLRSTLQDAAIAGAMESGELTLGGIALTAKMGVLNEQGLARAKQKIADDHFGGDPTAAAEYIGTRQGQQEVAKNLVREGFLAALNKSLEASGKDPISMMDFMKSQESSFNLALSKDMAQSLGLGNKAIQGNLTVNPHTGKYELIASDVHAGERRMDGNFFSLGKSIVNYDENKTVLSRGTKADLGNNVQFGNEMSYRSLDKNTQNMPQSALNAFTGQTPNIYTRALADTIVGYSHGIGSLTDSVVGTLSAQAGAGIDLKKSLWGRILSEGTGINISASVDGQRAAIKNLTTNDVYNSLQTLAENLMKNNNLSPQARAEAWFKISGNLLGELRGNPHDTDIEKIWRGAGLKSVDEMTKQQPQEKPQTPTSTGGHAPSTKNTMVQ